MGATRRVAGSRLVVVPGLAVPHVAVPRVAVRRPRRAGGFSLLEVLVVLVILAVLASAAVLGWPSRAVRGAPAEALLAFAERLQRGADRAVLQGQHLGLEMGGGEYRLLALATDGDWRVLEEAGLAGSHPLPGRLSLQVDGERRGLPARLAAASRRAPLLVTDALGGWPLLRLELEAGGLLTVLEGGAGQPFRVRAP